MFDIGFSELMVIGVVALIVIGPEKLPRVARTVGHLAGRLQRYVSDVKADINREIELDELRKMRDSMQQAASNFESSVQSEMSKTETELNKSVEAVVGDVKPPEEKPAEAKKPEEDRQNGRHERRAGKLHLPPGRAAPAAGARGRRGAGAVRGAVHLLARLGRDLRLPRRAADERAARRREDDRHRRDHAVHGADEGHRAGRRSWSRCRTCSTRRGRSSRRGCTSTRSGWRCR